MSKKCKCKRDPFNKSLFIAEVYKRRALWDKRYEGHGKRNNLERLWREVGISMGFKCDTELEGRKIAMKLRIKWKNLKDAFRKEARRTMDEPGFVPRWRHYNSLMFLFDQFNFTEAMSEHTIPSQSLQFVYGDMSLQEDDSLQTEEDCTMQDPLNSEDDVIHIKEDPDELTTEDYSNNTTTIANENQSNNSNEDDADMYFFKSLLPYMKELSPQKRMHLKIKIHELLYNEVYGKQEILNIKC